MKSQNIEITNWLTKGVSDEQLKIEKALSIISAQIYTRRTKMGLDQRAFAKFMGVTQGMISKWESGTYNFSIASLIRICEKIDLTFEPYICDEEAIRPNITFVDTNKTSYDSQGWVSWKPTRQDIIKKGVA